MEENYNINTLSSINSHPQPYPGHSAGALRAKLQRVPSVDSKTLPPINGLPMQSYHQMYNGHGANMNGSLPQTPQTPITPQTPHSQAGATPQEPDGYSQQPSQNGAPPRTLQPPPSFPVSSAGTAPMSAQSPYPMPGIPRTNELLPRIQHPQMSPPQMPSSHMPQSMSSHYHQPGSYKQDPEPTHVVGQQGRRGILPSAPGRAPVNGKTQIPPKNEEGKFPCAHCNKTYLHAKHLKRHMLRHTGDRPYQCKLCKDTFSRSDILKRHFQKCSIRRGHTGDQNHLEGSRNHLKQQQGNPLPPNLANDPHYYNGPVTSGPSMDAMYAGQHYGMSMQPSMQPYMQHQENPFDVNSQSLSNRSSRSNSLMPPQNEGMMAVSMGGPLSGIPAQSPYGMPSGLQSGYHFTNPVTTADMGGNQVRTAGANDDPNGMMRPPHDQHWGGN